MFMNNLETEIQNLKDRTEYLKKLLAELEENIKEFKSDCQDVQSNWKKMWND